jgi:hypothetical protein
MPAMTTFPAPARFPAGAGMVFGVGAQKAGTSWLYEVLAQSPRCHFSPDKELHYFDVWSGTERSHLKARMRLLAERVAQLQQEPTHDNRIVLQRIAQLTALLSIHAGPQDPAHPHRHHAYFGYLLQGRQDQPVICDFTPSYALLATSTFAEMARIGPPDIPARFVFVMRDPVDRMWSQMRMLETVEGTPGHGLAAACAARVERMHASGRLPRVERADYRRTIRNLEAAVPRARIHYAFYETIFDPARTQAQADALCAFLGIAPVAVDPGRRVNPGAPAAIPPRTADLLRRAYAPQYAFVRDRFADLVPDAWQPVADLR